MEIRRAVEKDIDQILNLLSQVLEIHAKIRPDIFISGTTKYTREELSLLINSDSYLIYVVCEGEIILGYAFCGIVSREHTNTMVNNKIFFVDDFCVDEKYRKQHIGTILFEFLKKEAKNFGCYEICLYQWEGNDGARKFYEKMGMKVKATTLEYII